VWRSRTPNGVWCAPVPNVITTLMDHFVQLLKPLNLRELYNIHVAEPIKLVNKRVVISALLQPIFVCPPELNIINKRINPANFLYPIYTISCSSSNISLN
jgi:hypothetical protein